jgi:signal transduction histidine kinase
VDDTTDCPPPRRAALIISAVAIDALTAFVWWTLIGADTTRTLVLDTAVAVVACVLVPVMLRWPIAGGVALGALAALSPVGTPGSTVAALTAARQRPFRPALLVAATGVAAHAVQGLLRPHGLPYGWWLLLITLAYAALVGWGALARSRDALMRSLRERAHRAEEEQSRRIAEAQVAERARIAREMHDVLAHRLSLVAMYAGALEYRPDLAADQVATAAGVIRDGVHQALDELRGVITLLRDETDADPPTTEMLAQVPHLIDESREAGVDVRLDDRVGAGTAVPATVGRTAYRIVQEALTNARKHAAGEPVAILIDGSPGERLVIDVRNAVPGHAPLVPGAGVGLVGLAERVQLAGGRLDHEISAGREFHLHAWLPWRA